MDKTELVKRLQGWVNSHGVGSYGSIGADLVADAIAYISSTPSRDEVLEEATQSLWKFADQAWLVGVIDTIRALKSTPAPQVEQKIVVGLERGLGGKSPTFTRTDGTTSPVKVFKGCSEKQKPGGCQLHNLHCGYPACDTQPAQEAPQPEKVGPTYSAAFKAEFVDRKAFGHPDIPTNCERPTWSHYYWLLRELDRRQGAK